jgi:hypothetical protein
VRPEDALARVLALTGVGFPRGVLGDETRALADALSGVSDGDVADLAGRAAGVHWPLLRAPMRAVVERGAAQAGEGPDREAFEFVLAWARSEDPDNPLARALAVRAAAEFGTARARARERMSDAEEALTADDVAAAARATSLAGVMAIALLDLDPEDFEPEIALYLGGSRAERDVDELARSTGDPELRAWAREAVAGIDEPAAPVAVSAVRGLASGPPPADPAHDLVWVPAILALVEEALERVLVDDAAARGAGAPPPGGGEDGPPGAP